jgi:hypothetical protein
MSNINWDDPAARLELIERVGADEYNRLHAEHMKRQTVATVNGYGIRKVNTPYGQLFAVDGTTTTMAFRTLDEAEAYARECQPKRED